MISCRKQRFTALQRNIVSYVMLQSSSTRVHSSGESDMCCAETIVTDIVRSVLCRHISLIAIDPSHEQGVLSKQMRRFLTALSERHLLGQRSEEEGRQEEEKKNAKEKLKQFLKNDKGRGCFIGEVSALEFLSARHRNSHSNR